MATQILLTVPDDVYYQARKLAINTQRDIADVLLETITRSFAPFPVDPNREQMYQEVQAYKKIHPELVAQYLGA